MIEHKDTSAIENPALHSAYVSPASYAQQRLWFLSQLLPDSSLYNIAHVLRIGNRLESAALERSLNEIVRRHDSLRTTFAAIDGVPMQVVAETLALPLPRLDLTSEPDPVVRQQQIQHLVEQEAGRPFDLTHGPLLRTTLLQVAEQEYLLLLTMHHIISDGWSMSVFLHELAALYPAFVQGQPSPLPELPIQYADYAEWQREWLQGEERARLLSYWTRQLEGLAPLELPTDHPRPAFFSYRGEHVTFEIPAKLTQALNALSQQEQVTLFMTLQAALQTLLARYSGQQDIAVGSPIANRTRTELEGLIGFFVNTLVLRTDLSGNPSFRTLLQRVRETLLDAYAHQDLPFEHLVEELRVPRDPSRNPLFQVMFVFQNTPSAVVELAGSTLELQESYIGAAKFDLLLSVTEQGDKLAGFFEYSTDLFEEATIRRLLAHYLTLLEGIVAHPACSLADLPLLPASERQLLLSTWNATATSFPDLRCVHELIEDQVARTPDALAIEEATGQRLSYQQFNTRANHLAHYLQGLGVRPGQRVGVYLPRSLDALVSLLAILKAGAAYVPIDPANPQDRVAYMLADAQISILLTQQELLPSLPSDQPIQPLCLQRDWSRIAQTPASNPRSGACLEDLLYVIYTSGSTGKPKGVAMTHRSLGHLRCWQLATMVPPRAARLLQYASLSFDVSFQEIFPTLSAGGSIHLITEDLRRDPLALLQAISARQLQKFYLPMVALQQLADAAAALPDLDLSHLREITAAGEQLRITPQMIAFFQRARHCTLHNFYGPTETHGVTLFTLQGPPQTWPTLVPIGQPIANTQVYILDAHAHPLPIGIAGELFLGGIGVAEGYLNRPQLTAERFVPDPFSGQASARLYKTGDLARWRADGQIEFLGRIDHQVKIRGFRVELEEIEAVLNQHPGVRENVVILREDVPGDKRLVAYLVTEPERRPGLQELRSLLQSQLPEYMQPAHLLFLDALPLTLNRKVDRKRLPAPDQSRPEIETAFVAPTTPTEQELARIWLDLLRLQRVGVQDNFFQLGGHSLLVTQVVSRVRAQLGAEISVQDLFAAPTIAELARRVDELLLNHLDTTDIDDMLALLDGMDDAEAERMLKGLDVPIETHQL